ncbi:MAG: hypothetical protein Q9182_002818 [Xanthomendoza sp. 2 TL-2023]
MARIRGVTPTSLGGEDEMVITDPILLARLDEINRHTAMRMAEYIEASRQRNLAEYQPPPDILTPGRPPDSPVGGLPSPTATIPDGYFDYLPHLNHQAMSVPTPPANLNRPQISTTEDPPHQPPVMRDTRQLQPSTRSIIITRSRATPSTPFIELDISARAGRKATSKPFTLAKRTSPSTAVTRTAVRSNGVKKTRTKPQRRRKEA